MLLSCCFREPKPKKQKKAKNSNEEYSKSKEVCLEQEAAPSLLQEEDVPPVYTLHHSTAKAATGQERHPPSRETRRLLKQRSQESVRSGEKRSLGGEERRSTGGEEGRKSGLGEEGRRSVLGEEGRRSLLGDDGRRSVLGEEGRRSVLVEEGRRSVLGEEGRRSVLGEEGRRSVLGDEGSRSLIVEKRRSCQREEGSRSAAALHAGEEEGRKSVGGVEGKIGLGAEEVRKSEGCEEGKRSVGERRSTYLQWAEQPCLPSPPATPPGKGAPRPLSALFCQISAVPQYQRRAAPSSLSPPTSSLSSPLQHEAPPSPSSSSSSLQSMEEKEVRPIVRGLRKSTGFHDASLLEERLEEEERSRLVRQGEQEMARQELEREKEEERERAVKESETKLRQVLEAEFAVRLKRLESVETAKMKEREQELVQRLAEEQEQHSKELQAAVMEAKNEANRTISQLNRQVVAERSKLVAEQQENSRQLEEEWRMKEERLQQGLVEVEEREGRWQEERGEVLQEVQRLKAEAGRMVAILAMEAEEENISEERKLSLGQEVYSLQLVVEMRTGEVRSLRQQLALAQQQLEEMKNTKSLLAKATARLDDLQEQVLAKSMMEKQLSIEKCQLEDSVTSSNKEVLRMSQNVEELQWRIRNNFELPIIHHSREAGELGSPTSPLDSPIHHRHSSSRKSSMFSVSEAMIEATTNLDQQQTQTSDFSPSSEGISSSLPGEGREQSHYREGEGEEGSGEVSETDSLDEGLGDISSENETAESPQPAEETRSETLTVSRMERLEGQEGEERRMCQQLSLRKGGGETEERRKILDLQLSPTSSSSPHTQPKSPIKSPEDRRPGRIAFES